MERKIYLLWFGQTISWTGSSMSFFAIGVWIYETTGKASALSTILFIVAIVGVVTGPFGGVLADRFQRKKLIIIFDLTIAVLMCIIGYLALNDILTLTLLIPFALAFGIFEIAHWTTWSAFLGDVVKKNEVTKISALFESAEAISVLIGPIGGAFIYSFFGLPGVILVDVKPIERESIALLRFTSAIVAATITSNLSLIDLKFFIASISASKTSAAASNVAT